MASFGPIANRKATWTSGFVNVDESQKYRNRMYGTMSV
jgi:hypothetical protein